MAATSPTTKTASIGILLIALGGFVVWQFQVTPLREATETRKQKEAVSAGKDRDIKALTAAGTQLTQKESLLSGLGVTRDTLAAVLPPTEDVPGLYLQMEAVFQKSTGLSNTSYQIGKPVADASGDATIPLTISATGKYADLKRLITKLETVTRPLSFTSLTFAVPTEGNSGSYVLTAVATAKGLSISPAYTAPATAAN